MNTEQVLTNKLLTIIDQLQGLVANHSQDAINLTLEVTRINCMQGILINFFQVILIFAFIKAIKILFKLSQIDEIWEGWEPALIIGSVMCCIAILIGCLGLFSTFDMFNYVGIFSPKIALAHSILFKAGLN